MRNLLFERYARVFVSTASVVIPISLGMFANAQPPLPRSEVVAEPPTSGSQAQDRSESDQSNGLEYLTRAPLHEAFAGPYDANPTPSLVVKKEPPQPIDELPPEYRPSGDNVTWIPGYWSWDDERTDFIWISGVWRDIPPRQRWIPGYWANVSDGYQYVSGFWAGDQVADVEYLPEPPKSLEQGPASPSPGEDYFYVPGNWVYQSSDYQWQPGFWSKAQQNWVWVPSQYVWTPTGCIYQNGYWDYDVSHRGVVFTPVYFQQPVYRQPQYTYRPRYTVDTGLALFVHLFVRPNYRQYYFGDYYGSSYANTYYPWSTRYQSNRYYDPFFASYSHWSRGGGNSNYMSWITNQYQLFANNQRYRPARTISAQRDFLRKNNGTDIDPSVLRLTSIGESLDNLVQSNGGQQGFQRLTGEEIDRFRDGIAPQRQLGQDRLKTETGSGRTHAPANTKEASENSPNSDVNLAADAKANVDSDKRADANLNVNANGRGRLRLPEIGRRANDTENNLGRNNPDSANDPLDAARNGRLGEMDGRADKAVVRASNAASGARKNGATTRDQLNEARQSIREDAESLNRSGREIRSDTLNRIDNAAGAVDNTRRPATEPLRPKAPENWPAAIPRQPGGKIPGRPEANFNGRGNAKGESVKGNNKGVRARTGSGGKADVGPSVDRALDRASRPMNTRQPSVGGGNPATDVLRGVDRGGGGLNRDGGATQPAGPSAKGAGGAKSSGKPAKKSKDK